MRFAGTQRENTKTKAILTAVVVALTGSGACVSNGAVIFSQDFSSSSTVSDYVSATPNDGQWNAIGSSGAGVTFSIVGGALEYSRPSPGANAGSFSRTTDFSPAPVALIYSFDLGVSGNTVAQTTAAVLQVGSGFGTANSAEANAAVHSRFGINLSDTDGTFSLRNIGGNASSGSFSGTQSIMWIINNTGSELSYVGPDSSAQTAANDTWDLWVGNTSAFDDVAAQTSTQPLTDLKFAFTLGVGTITMDNFSIQAVPEPAEWGLICAVGLLGVCGLRTWRERRRAQRQLPSAS